MPLLSAISPSAHDDKLSSSIIHTLKKRILHWEYPPDHLLTEKDICKEFQVSRSPVREALRVLETTGLIHKKNTQGYLVKQIGLAEVQELYDLRLAIEFYAIEALTKNLEKHAAVRTLREEWAECSLETKSNLELAKIDQEFHETLVSLAGNGTMLDALRRVNERLFIFRMIDFEQRERVQTTYVQHLDILDAILTGDVALARQSLEKNVAQGRNYVHVAIRDMLVRSFDLR